MVHSRKIRVVVKVFCMTLFSFCIHAQDDPKADIKATATPPQLMQDIKSTATPAKEPIDTTLDMVDIEEGGNWLKVRKALEDTVDAIEDINILFTKILDERMNFLKKRNKADKAFEDFLQTIGMDVGDFNRQIDMLIAQLEEERKEDGELSEEERAVLAAANQKKQELKALQDDVKNIMEYDTRIDDTLMALEDQINTCRDYQNQAWKNFQAIKKVYNDEKAERLYQKTENVLSNMQQIFAYLQGDLTQYLDNTISMLNTAMNSANSTLKSMKAKGVDLRTTLEKLELKEEQQEDMQKIEEAKEQQKADDEDAFKKRSLWSRIISTIVSAVTSTLNYVSQAFNVTVGWVKNWFIKKAVPVQPVAQEPLVETGTQEVNA